MTDATLLVESDDADLSAWPADQDVRDTIVRPIGSAADPGTVERLHDGLDTVTTRFVFVTGADHLGGGNVVHTIEHNQKLADELGLAEAGFPLLMLTAWRDVHVTDAYRSWLELRHPELLAEHRQQLDDYLHLTRFRSVLSIMHGVDVVDGGTTLRLIGRARRGGTDGPTPPIDHRVMLQALDDDDTPRLSVETTPVLTSDRVPPSWFGFTVDIPISSLPVGRFRFVVELDGPPGHPPHRSRVQATVGLLSSSRAIASGGRRFQVLQAGDTYRVDILVRDAEAPLARLRWALMMIGFDLKAFVRRRPYGGVRIARLLTRPFFGRRPIWLVGERSDTARDNGYHLFAYLRRERKDIRAYYVIDRESDQYDMMAALGRVIPHSSWRHRLLTMHATVHAGAYSLKYLLPRQWDPVTFTRQLAWRLGAYRVYLKHGINDKMAVKRRINGYDLYFTGVEDETAAARRDSGYDRQIVQAGLARFDALIPTPPSRTILFMPTWRSYLVPKLFTDLDTSDQAFEGSDYQQFMLGFLTSERLRDLLDQHDTRLQFMPHYNLADRMSDVQTSTDRIERIGAADANIQAIMRTCDLFVTDYSSVHFDLAYLGTPLVYTHFDREAFQAEHAQTSWFVHETDGFGPVAYDLEGTLDAIEHYLANGMVREQLYTDRARKAFVFQDTDNCLRTTQAIEELIRTRGLR